MARNFEAHDARREQVPVLVGLFGPSGSGKTYSALRIATGMQAIVGGDIYGIDTEAKRMLHYADAFKFKHVPFAQPFGALDYLEALRFCVAKGAKVIVVDSMSHEHEGPGGLLDAAEEELKRLAGKDYGTWQAEKYKMQSWIKPKAARRALINGILQLNANFVFCFRAKETVRPVRVKNPDTGRVKTEIVPQGFMPIAGEEFLFEQTVNCLLPPHSDGVPQWDSELPGERMLMKLPAQFRAMFKDNRQLDEEMGRALATWARGEKTEQDPGTKQAREQGGPSAAADGGTTLSSHKSQGVASPAPQIASGFIFKVKSTTGGISETTDGEKWADALIKMFAIADNETALARYDRNKNFIAEARAAGETAHADRVDAAWNERKERVSA